MKKTIFIIMALLIYSLKECDEVMFDTDVPCMILYANGTTACASTTISFYTNSTLLYTQTMTQFNTFNCNTTFNQTNHGTYTFLYSTGDSGTMTVEQDVNNRYYLYLVAVMVFFILLALGHYLEEPTFTVIAGMLSCVIALNIFNQGFPNLTNVFLKNGISIIFAGVGFYFILKPSLDYFEKKG